MGCVTVCNCNEVVGCVAVCVRLSSEIFCALCLQVAEEIWVCNNQTVTKWEGDIFEYKESLVRRLEKLEKREAAQQRK